MLCRLGSKVVHKDISEDLMEQQQEALMPIVKHPFYLEFILQFADYSKLLTRKLRLLIPSLCVYQNGEPISLI
jgi:hypothetical protein